MKPEVVIFYKHWESFGKYGDKLDLLIMYNWSPVI